jgi:Raf kinase inhibitor-like YbhB/YbcL family protein
MSIGDTIKSVTKGMPAMVTGGQPGYRAGEQKLAWNKPEFGAGINLNVSSEAFEEGQPIPKRYSGDGENVSPPVAWSGSVPGVQSYALVVEDPDAPTPEPFVHWLIYNIPASVRQLPENVGSEPGQALQGKNSRMKTGWIGMGPPKGDTAHRYFFQLFALDTVLDLEGGAGRGKLFDAMSGHVIGRGRLMGTYQRG